MPSRQASRNRNCGPSTHLHLLSTEVNDPYRDQRSTAGHHRSSALAARRPGRGLPRAGDDFHRHSVRRHYPGRVHANGVPLEYLFELTAGRGEARLIRAFVQR